MAYPLPNGTLSAYEAVNRLATVMDHEWTTRQAWSAIRDLARKGTLPAYVLNGGQSYEADRAQFAALGDQEPMMLDFRQFASTTLESLDASCFPRNAIIPGMTRILPPAMAVQTRHVYGQLFFFKDDLDAAFWATMEPKNLVESIAKRLREMSSTRLPQTAKELLRTIEAEERFGVPGLRNVERAMSMAWRL